MGNSSFQKKIFAPSQSNKKQDTSSQQSSFTDKRKSTDQISQLQSSVDNSIHSQEITQLQQKVDNTTGMPDDLKQGVEGLSGQDMSDVKVTYNSDKPAQLNAHAYAQGNNIHLGPGQEKHLPHEAWHVVQQKQGRVQPTKQLKSHVNINNDTALEKEADIMGAKADSQLNNTQNKEKTKQLKLSNNLVQLKFKPTLPTIKETEEEEEKETKEETKPKSKQNEDEEFKEEIEDKKKSFLQPAYNILSSAKDIAASAADKISSTAGAAFDTGVNVMGKVVDAFESAGKFINEKFLAFSNWLHNLKTRFKLLHYTGIVMSILAAYLKVPIYSTATNFVKTVASLRVNYNQWQIYKTGAKAADALNTLANILKFGAGKLFRRLIKNVTLTITSASALIIDVIGVIYPAIGTAVATAFESILSSFVKIGENLKGVKKWIFGNLHKQRISNVKKFYEYAIQGGPTGDLAFEILKTIDPDITEDKIRATLEPEVSLNFFQKSRFYKEEWRKSIIGSKTEAKMKKKIMNSAVYKSMSSKTGHANATGGIDGIIGNIVAGNKVFNAIDGLVEEDLKGHAKEIASGWLESGKKEIPLPPHLDPST